MAPTLNAFDNATESRATVLAFDIKSGGSSDVAPTLRARPSTTANEASGSIVGVAILGDKTHALTTEGHDASQDGTGRGTPIVTAPTLTASNDPSRSPQSAEVTAQVEAVNRAAGGVRRLTPLECERLMGLPDNWTEGHADSVRYRQCGNAVVVPVAEWIGYLLGENA